jgi:GNAT superfamily N-acetyltransferase
MAELGYPTTIEAFARRAAAVHSNADDAVFVAEGDGQILGLVAAHSFEMLHKPGRLGRITALVVTSQAHGRGVGTALLEAAETHLLRLGCVMLEVTSAESRQSAHGFYKARGYDEKRVRFVKIPGSN